MIHNNHHMRYISFALILLGAAACGDDDTDPQDNPYPDITPGSIADFLVNDPRFTVFAELANRSGILGELNDLGGSEYTVFVPTDAAFNALPDRFMVTQNFVSNGNPALITTELSSEGITTMVNSHIIDESLSAEDVSAVDDPLETLAGSPLSVLDFDPTKENGFGEDQDNILILGERARVIQGDQVSQNGTVHVIDAVLIPTQLLAGEGELEENTYPGTLHQLFEATPIYRPFLDALRAAEATSLLGALSSQGAPLTILLPLEKLEGLIESHTPGSGDLLNTLAVHIYPETDSLDTWIEQSFAENEAGARITVTPTTPGLALAGGIPVISSPIATSNGTVYLLDGVVTVPNSSAADLITGEQSLTSFSRLLKNTVVGSETLLDTLRDPSLTFTVFAPNNQAITKLGDLNYGTDTSTNTTFTDELVAADLLDEVLNYHIVDDLRVELTEIDQSVVSRLGENISIGTLGPQTPALNKVIEVIDTSITEPDSGNTSVVHTIGNVLLPSEAVIQANDLARPQDEFPGTTSQALAYFSAFSAFHAQLSETPLPGLLPLEGKNNDEGPESAPIFGGTLEDILRFDEGDPSFIKDEEEQAFPGELVSPYAASDANFAIESTTVFAVVNAGLPANFEQFVFESGSSTFLPTDVLPLHVVFGTLTSEQLIPDTLPTLTVQTGPEEAGSLGKFFLEIETDTDAVLVNGLSVVAEDIITNNGVIHVLDNALTPILTD